MQHVQQVEVYLQKIQNFVNDVDSMVDGVAIVNDLKALCFMEMEEKELGFQHLHCCFLFEIVRFFEKHSNFTRQTFAFQNIRLHLLTAVQKRMEHIELFETDSAQSKQIHDQSKRATISLHTRNCKEDETKDSRACF